MNTQRDRAAAWPESPLLTQAGLLTPALLHASSPLIPCILRCTVTPGTGLNMSNWADVITTGTLVTTLSVNCFQFIQLIGRVDWLTHQVAA